jgi:hypothetical protein
MTGRPPKYPLTTVNAVGACYERGDPIRSLAAYLGVTVNALKGLLRRHGFQSPRGRQRSKPRPTAAPPAAPRNLSLRPRNAWKPGTQWPGPPRARG